MGKIERGCMAIVVDDDEDVENIGKIVRVGDFIGTPCSEIVGGVRVDFLTHSDIWEVDADMAWSFDGGQGKRAKFYRKMHPENGLRRIDDTDENELVINQRELEVMDE